MNFRPASVDEAKPDTKFVSSCTTRIANTTMSGLQAPPCRVRDRQDNFGDAGFFQGAAGQGQTKPFRMLNFSAA